MSRATLLGPAEIRDLADLLDIQPTKKLGQNFVHDANTVRRIVAAAGVDAPASGVEIGPGLGSLTLGLPEAGAPRHRGRDRQAPRRAAADDRVAAAARGRPDGRRRRRHARRRSCRRAPTHLVANLPYNISVPVLLHFLENFPSLERGLVMVQAEVGLPPRRRARLQGLRLAEHQGRLVRRVRRPPGQVSRQVFWPVPNVDSILVAFDRHEPPGHRGRARRGLRAGRRRVPAAPQDAAAVAVGRLRLVGRRLRRARGRRPVADRARRAAHRRRLPGTAHGRRAEPATRADHQRRRAWPRARAAAASSGSPCSTARARRGCPTRRSRASSSTSTRCADWWAQSITVRYEQARGMRLPGQQPDGTFSVAVSRSLRGEPLELLDLGVERFAVVRRGSARGDQPVGGAPDGPLAPRRRRAPASSGSRRAPAASAPSASRRAASGCPSASSPPARP